jgi:hypothetical protein
MQTQITDAGVENLGGHPGFRVLDLNETNVTGKGISVLAKGQPHLVLRMARAAVTDASLQHVDALKNTSSLELYLAHNSIGDAGLVHLGKLTNLTSLELAGTDITDEGLSQLTNLTRLTYLDVTNTKCTAKGVAALQRALPSLKNIEFSPRGMR